ncbi:hypothetical protein, partial [Apilactobacillus kunkeei]|uniref:hypothetical protein n=1 Tax=Apilactobacillus kunkeei TaxID=148814 RepID=UPI0040332FAC
IITSVPVCQLLFLLIGEKSYSADPLKRFGFFCAQNISIRIINELINQELKCIKNGLYLYKDLTKKW